MADSKPPAVALRAAAPSAGVAVAETDELADPLGAAELGPLRPPSRPTGMLHSLMSTEPGHSEIEVLADKVESRRANRIVVTQFVRCRLLHECRKIVQQKNYTITSRITLGDLLELRVRIQEELNEQPNNVLTELSKKLLFVKDNTETLLKVIDKAIGVVHSHRASAARALGACSSDEYESSGKSESQPDYFYYQDFNFYHTQAESRFFWFRPGITRSFMIVFLYYFITPIWFCHIQPDSNICPSIGGKPYAGWVSALYFASTTLSTVGYGDLSVTGNTNWSLFQGSMFMLFSNFILIFAFGEVAANSFAPLEAIQTRLNAWILGKPNDGELLWKKIRRLKVAMAIELIGQFILLIAIGICATQVYRTTASVPEEQWNFMTSFYWAIQTTTTVGYGDLSMGVELRWFQIFYLMASTYYVGNAISGLASLKDRLDEVRRQFAWSRREVSKGMVVDMQGDGDDTIDQYEFAMASLLALGKVSSDDLRPIMDKYRELVNPRTGFIIISEACEEKVTNDATLQRMSSTSLRKRGVRSDERFSTLNHHDVAKLEDENALDQLE